MTITPDQASELLDGATPGPWGRTGMGALTDTDGKALVTDPDGNMSSADADLAAAAPDMAETIAGMTEEWGVDANGDALFPVREEGHPMGSYFTPDRAEAEVVRARMAKLNPHVNYLLVRRMVSVAEVIEGE